MESPLRFPCKDGALKPKELRAGDEWEPPSPVHIAELGEDDEEDEINPNKDDSEDHGEPGDAGGGRPHPPEEAPSDFCSQKGIFLVRVHNVSRANYFPPLDAIPDDPPLIGGSPMSIENIDVKRTTHTDPHEFKGLTIIEDTWTGHGSDNRPVQRQHDGKLLERAGGTWLGARPPIAKPSEAWIRGRRVIRTKTTDRPRGVLPLEWKFASIPARLKIIKAQRIIYQQWQDARTARTTDLVIISVDEAKALNFEWKPMAIVGQRHKTHLTKRRIFKIHLQSSPASRERF